LQQPAAVLFRTPALYRTTAWFIIASKNGKGEEAKKGKNKRVLEVSARRRLCLCRVSFQDIEQALKDLFQQVFDLAVKFF
jgi:hypothetical protein